jgi:hypothetical protein
MTDSQYRELTDHELALLAALLDEAFQGRAELVQQLPGIRGRQIDEDGSLALVATGPPAPVAYREPITGHGADSDGADVQVLLHGCSCWLQHRLTARSRSMVEKPQVRPG